MKEALTVSIVIPNYNGETLLSQNLPSVLSAQENKSNNIIETIIVDDASTDGSVKLIKERFREVKLIQHKKNRGFASSVNTGARTAKGELLVLLNSDVRPSIDFLKSIQKHYENPKVFGVSLHEAGFGPAKAKFEDGFINHAPAHKSESTKDSFWISGGSGVFRRSVWMKLGGMDEQLFKFYWEDIDLSYRALKRGWTLLWEPNSKVIHEHESTTSVTFSKRKLSTMQEVNQLVFIWKNLTSKNLFKKHVAGLFRRITRHPGYFRIFVLALFKLRQIARSRKKEKREAKVSDETILIKFK